MKKIISIKTHILENRVETAKLKYEYLALYDTYLSYSGKAKDDAHELKTPLNGIIGVVDLLEISPDKIDQLNIFENIRDMYSTIAENMFTEVSTIYHRSVDLSAKHDAVMQIINNGKYTDAQVHYIQAVVKEMDIITSAIKQTGNYDFSELVQELDTLKIFTDDLSKMVNEESGPLIEMILDSIAVMKGIISKEQGSMTPVLVNSLVNDIEAGQKHLINEKSAQVINDGLPKIIGDRILLYQVFNNIISNAIKYNDNTAPIVKISATELEDKWIFTISDNGIGIDPKHHKDIFISDKRVPGVASKYVGSGIGLGVCKTRLNEVGCDIWVESSLGEGSIFYFTYPKYGQDK